MNTTISSDNNEQTQIQNNRIGTAGLVLVLMSFILFSFEGYIINSLNDKSLFFTLILPVLIGNLWLLGLIFSIIGLRINPKGRAIAGLIISLLPIILFLFTAIIVSPQISTPIHFENELKERKTQAIERIKDVRTAQRAFRAEYQRYAENFDELERFLYTNPTELRCDIEQLRYIPNSDNEFIMETGFTKTSSNRTGPFIEVRAPYKLFLDTIKYRQEIINLIDEEVNVFDRYPGIKFGSMEEANNEVGNWEE
ncbi:hypothetical protein [uncultured Alistipes sp.]|jgi:hypothetical protein|uniref:hypothetical protein n=1 Tax=uncultured Alistipes sp. TaxID=538949 RepID=UPI0025DD7DA0|nr:hypothetical protein [uncultured Alistipes sp.]